MTDQHTREAVDRALAATGPASWTDARTTLFGGSTARTAAAAGVSVRTVQRWIATEQGRQGQARRPAPARLARVARRAALERIRDGAPVSYSFAGDVAARSGGRRDRAGTVRTASRDTGGFVGMDPEAARAWARAELARES